MNIQMIEAAAKRLDGIVRRTPLLSSPALDALAGRAVYVKPECLQKTGSFKFRGGYAALSSLSVPTSMQPAANAESRAAPVATR